MKPLKSQEFLASPAALKAASAYLVIGSDSYIVEKVCRALRELIRKKLPAYEAIVLWGDELSVSEISEYLDSYSIFAEERLLIIRNAHRLGEENKNRKAPERMKLILSIIAKYLANPEPTQALIVIADSVDGRISEWKKIKEACQVIECDSIKYSNEMRAWLDSSLKANQKTMNSEAKNLFLEKVELDYKTADNELEKIMILVGERKNITLADVHTTLPTTRAGSLTEFYRALGSRNTASAVSKVLDMLENDWADLQILSNLFRFFFNLWRIQTLRAKHITVDEIISRHLKDIFENQRRDYFSYAAKYTPKELVKAFELIFETDSQIKLSMAEPEILLTICITKICNDK